jgi:AcrR family transcriptional regulator
MRRLAADLGVHPNAVYSHVRDKEELLDALVDRLLGEIPLPDGSGPWRDELLDLMRASRRVLLAHPGLVPLVVARPKLGPNADRLTATIDHLFGRGEVDRSFFAPLLIYLFGFAAFEAPRLADPEHRAREEDFENGLRWLLDGAIAGSR